MQETFSVRLQLSPNLGDGRVRRRRVELRSDTSIPVGELYTEDDFKQRVVAIEATPASPGGFAGERGLLERLPLECAVRWRTVANELSMMWVVRRCFQRSAGKS